MNHGGFTPLLYAARGGCLECVKRLLAGGVDVDLPDPEAVTPLILAITTFHFDVADHLVEAGQARPMGPVRPHGFVCRRRHEHDRVARWARACRRTRARDIIKKLLEHGANPNTQLKLRRPEFRNAIGERGADNSLATGATPLLRAAHAADVETIEQLLAHGALVDLPNATGLTPFMAPPGSA